MEAALVSETTPVAIETYETDRATTRQLRFKSCAWGRVLHIDWLEHNYKDGKIIANFTTSIVGSRTKQTLLYACTRCEQCYLNFDGQHFQIWLGDAAINVTTQEASEILRTFEPVGLRRTNYGQQVQS